MSFVPSVGPVVPSANGLGVGGQIVWRLVLVTVQRALLILGLLAVGCTPAIIGISFAAGGATVGVTYEILGEDEPRDAGSDAEGERW